MPLKLDAKAAKRFEDASKEPDLQGFLMKKNPKGKKQRRWACLKRNHLYYSKDQASTGPQGIIYLTNAAVSESTTPFTIVIKTLKGVSVNKPHLNRVYEFICANDTEKKQWIETLNANIKATTIRKTMKMTKQDKSNLSHELREENLPSYSANQTPLPSGWAIESDSNGGAYFIDHNTKTTTYEDPRKNPANKTPVKFDNSDKTIGDPVLPPTPQQKENTEQEDLNKSRKDKPTTEWTASQKSPAQSSHTSSDDSNQHQSPNAQTAREEDTPAPISSSTENTSKDSEEGSKPLETSESSPPQQPKDESNEESA